MDVKLSIPDNLARRIAVGGNLARRTTEALALDEYRHGNLTVTELAQLLAFEAEADLKNFLMAHGIDAPATLVEAASSADHADNIVGRFRALRADKRLAGLDPNVLRHEGRR